MPKSGTSQITALWAESASRGTASRLRARIIFIFNSAIRWGQWDRIQRVALVGRFGGIQFLLEFARNPSRHLRDAAARGRPESVTARSLIVAKFNKCLGRRRRAPSPFARSENNYRRPRRFVAEWSRPENMLQLPRTTPCDRRSSGRLSRRPPADNKNAPPLIALAAPSAVASKRRHAPICLITEKEQQGAVEAAARQRE